MLSLRKRIRPSHFPKNTKPLNRFYKLFLKDNGSQKEWVLLFSILVPILLAIWGLIISLDNSDNREQIKHLIKSNAYLQKIYDVSDSTSKSTLALRELPATISDLNNTLNTLNTTLKKEIVGLEKGYNSLNTNYNKINKLVELTNDQIALLGKNNKMINDEYSRRPKIIISSTVKEKNGKYYIDEFNVYNAGNIEFRFVKFSIEVSDNCIHNDSIGVVHLLWTRLSKNTYEYYVFVDSQEETIGGTSSIIPIATAGIRHDFFFASRKIKISYKMNYISRYISEPISGDVIIK